MAGTDYFYKVGDHLPAFTGICRSPDGTPKDLTGATVVLIIRKKGETSGSSYAMTIVSATAGSVSYTFLGTEMTTPGEYEAEIEETDSTSKKTTYPKDRYLRIEVKDDLN